MQYDEERETHKYSQNYCPAHKDPSSKNRVSPQIEAHPFRKVRFAYLTLEVG